MFHLDEARIVLMETSHPPIVEWKFICVLLSDDKEGTNHASFYFNPPL